MLTKADRRDKLCFESAAAIRRTLRPQGLKVFRLQVRLPS